jgi:hypothetical protein
VVITSIPLRISPAAGRLFDGVPEDVGGGHRQLLPATDGRIEEIESGTTETRWAPTGWAVRW